MQYVGALNQAVACHSRWCRVYVFLHVKCSAIRVTVIAVDMCNRLALSLVLIPSQLA